MPAKPLSILLFEDSPTDAMLLEESLSEVVEFNFELDQSETLQAGLQNLNDKSYDAIILDLGLPDSFGLGTLDRVRTNTPKTPVIVLSGNDDRDLLASALQHGADNYLIKGVADGNRIAIAVMSAIRNRAQPVDDNMGHSHQ